MPQYTLLQVKSSQQFLNIYNGDFACQGLDPTTDNFLWQIVPDTAPYCKLQVKNSGGYLCLNNAGYVAQGTPPPSGPTPNNFLWQIIPAGPTYYNIQLKSNGLYMGITDPNGGNGSPASLANTPAASNFLWAKPVTINVVVANRVGSANPDVTTAWAQDLVVWTMTGANWPSGNGITFASNLLSILFPNGLRQVGTTVQGILTANANQLNPDGYNYFVNPISNNAPDDVMPLNFVDENGVSFDPKIIVHSKTPL